MSVIKQKFSLLAPSKVGLRLFADWGGTMTENGISESQAQNLCNKIAYMAYEQMGKAYTVMGGYSPEDQLFSKAQDLLAKLDESGELEKLVEPAINNDSSSEPDEADLEDAYNAADSIRFVGSEKQIKWAQSIAANNNRAIASSGLNFKSLPTAAKWWIDNRNDVYSALKAFN